MMLLPINEVHLWCADPRDLQPIAAYTAAQQIITTDERARLNRFRFSRDRLAFLATRLLARTVLSYYEPVEPKDWRFAYNEYGRPRIAGGIESEIQFNLSRTDGLVVCAIVRNAEIGVDVELLRPSAMLDVADRYFSPAEAAALRMSPPEEQASRFYDYWTLKESYIKARGLGLAIPLDRIEFVLKRSRRPRIRIDPELDDDANSWQFEQFRPMSVHVISLCVRRRGGVDSQVKLCWQQLSNSKIAGCSGD